MAERLDYEALAAADAAAVENWPVSITDAPTAMLARAQVHAMLAMAEQQRIANLVSLAAQGIPAAVVALVGEKARAEAGLGSWSELRPEIAVVLGVEAYPGEGVIQGV